MKAFHRSYVDDGNRGGQVRRLHIIRETPVRRQGVIDEDWPQALCGVSAAVVMRSRPVIADPMPATPPAGLTWCPHCLGRAADVLGFAPLVARLLAAANKGCAP